MNKIRQFSFQDQVGSRQSEATMELTNSPYTSCDTLNSYRQYNGFPPPSNAQNSSPWQKTQTLLQTQAISSNLLYENLPSSTKSDKLDEIQKFDHRLTDFPKVSRRKSGVAPGSSQKLSNENIDPQNECKMQNLNNQKENPLKENWERMDKINKMLADHKKKKGSYSRGPLSQVNENISSLELVVQDHYEENTSQWVSQNQQAQELDLNNRQESIPTETDHIEIGEVSYSYRDTEERPEQTFSPALNEPFAPVMNPIYDNRINSESENNENELKEIPLSDLRPQQSIISTGNSVKQNEASGLRESIKSELQETRKNSVRRLPIEEKLRLKDLEREARLKQLRDIKSQDDLKFFQSKPQISQNSKIIAKHSKRAVENAQVVEMLTSPGAKKGRFFPQSGITSQMQSQNSDIMKQSIESRNINSIQRTTHHSQKTNTVAFQNISLYKKNENEAAVSTANDALTYGTFNSNAENQEIPQNKYRFMEPPNGYRTIIEDDTLEIIEPLQHSSSSSSLQREASDRLAIAMAKKSSSQASSKEQRELYYSTENALYPVDTNFPSSTKTHQQQSKENKPLLKQTKADFIHEGDKTSTKIANPKQIYLKVSNTPFDRNPTKVDKIIHDENDFVSNLDQIYTRELTFESPRNPFNESAERSNERVQTPELIQVNDSLPTKESLHIETKKRSVRQPTFGVSSSNTFTNLSSKMNSNGESPEKIIASAFEQHEEEAKLQEVTKYSVLDSNKSKYDHKHSQASYLSSLKLRQQKFSNKENTFSAYPNDYIKNKLFIDAEEHANWLDIDVYMRNSLWLSAKNNKVAMQQTNKDKQEMRECTFHPKLGEKTYKLGLGSPKLENKVKLRGKEEKTKENSKKEVGFRQSLVSYRDLHANKIKIEQYNKEIKSTLNLDGLKTVQEDSSEPKISVELREDGQKYYLL